jgi:hypothetical protein
MAKPPMTRQKARSQSAKGSAEPTVALHGDAVQRVGDLHRALLVGDHDQLRGLLQLLHDPDQPAQVGVVERRLDLVHHIERAGPGLEDRDQQRHGGQRPLAAGEQREPLDLLARRPGLDLDAGGEHVLGVGQDQPALAAREQPAEDALELAGRVPKASVKTCSTRSSTSFTTCQQVGAGLLQVLQLLGEELVPLLQRRELLQRERVHLAELLARSADLSRFSCSARWNVGAGCADPPDHRAAPRPRRRARAARADAARTPRRAPRLHPQLLQRLALQLLDPHPLLGTEHFTSVHRVGQLVELALEVAPLVTGGGQLLLAARLGGIGGGALLVGAGRDTSTCASSCRAPKATASATAASCRSRASRCSARARASRSARAPGRASRPARQAP